MNSFRQIRIQLFFLIIVLFCAGSLYAEDGYELWLRYNKITDPKLLSNYSEHITQIVIQTSNPTLQAVQEELQKGLSGLLGKEIPVVSKVSQDGAVVISISEQSSDEGKLVNISELSPLGTDGYIIRSLRINNRNITVIAANHPKGVLYGAFDFLRLVQTHQSLDKLSITQKPRIQKRLLDHWDNLNGSIERGYAGRSIWKWSELPDKIDPRYRDYARANASIGINGSVLNNVNTQVAILTKEYIEKSAAIANVFRPYGIQVYLSIKFTAPMDIGGLKTADPLDPNVRKWWQDKAKEIYQAIPDFGGFLVKAYSEGQPGPQNYGRTHADGANMLAEALKPYGGIVMWRSFVYDTSIDKDRAKCAYLEFVPLDGKFASNIFIQTKNGPVDFQPREPFSPLFGAMPKTPLMMEFQITQEYTGQARHLVYQAPQWKEVLDSDTYAYGPGTPVAKIIDGSADKHTISGIAGVSGIGSDRNWSGHHFTQANWFAFGRLAWDPALSSEQIADEWIRMTWSNEPQVVDVIKKMMMGSWEACVDYMTPLGLHHIMSSNNHYGPEPSFTNRSRIDWSSTYYHRADANGIGFDRSSKGSNAVSQYHQPLSQLWDSPKTCPEKYLLWFHHLPWDYPMENGSTLWEQLKIHYQRGVDYVMLMQKDWDSLKDKIDNQRFGEVQSRLNLQKENALLWKDVCLKYFGRFAEK